MKAIFKDIGFYLILMIIVFQTYEYCRFGEDIRCNTFNPCQSQVK